MSSALIKLLEQDQSKYRWIAATEGSQEAAPIELATGGLAVVAIGGFNGSDPSPTLAQFEAMVAKHEIHYYVGRGSNSFGGGSGSTAIPTWVAHYTAQTVGGVTVYNLTKPSSSPPAVPPAGVLASGRAWTAAAGVILRHLSPVAFGNRISAEDLTGRNRLNLQHYPFPVKGHLVCEAGVLERG